MFRIRGAALYFDRSCFELLFGDFYVVILVFDCVSFCLSELFGFKFEESFNFIFRFLFSRIRREDYLSDDIIG